LRAPLLVTIVSGAENVLESADITASTPEPSLESTDLLTPREVAQRLKLSPTAVYALCDSGALPCHKVGLKRSRRRIREADLQAYLERAKLLPSISDLPGWKHNASMRGAGAFRLLRAAGWKG
jgi:excisionase family DNA binding protein